MDAIRRAYWYFVVHVIFLFLLKVAHLQMAPNLAVRLKDGMTLECVCPWNGNLSMISWSKEPDKTPIAIYHPVYGLNYSRHYSGRVTFLRSSQLDGSISFSSVTDQDVGHYRCSMQTFPKGSWYNDILVKKGGKFAPNPDTDASVDRGDHITVRCKYVSNGTVYQVAFEKIGEKTVETVAMCQYLTNGTLAGIKYKDSVKVNCSSILDTSLKLLNVTEQDGGLYRCFYNTDIEGQTIMLTIHEEGVLRFSQNMTYIYIGSAAAGLLLILVLVSALAWRHRRKKQRAKVRTKVHPVQRRLLNNYEQAASRVKTKKRPKERDDPVYCNVTSRPKRKT